MSLYEKILNRVDTGSDRDFREYLVSRDESTFIRKHSVIKLMIEAVEEKNIEKIDSVFKILSERFPDAFNTYPITMNEIGERLSVVFDGNFEKVKLTFNNPEMF